MASRSMYTSNNQFNITKSFDHINFNDDSLLNQESNYLLDCSSWLNSFVMSFDNSYRQSFQASLIDLSDHDVCSIHQLFTFIDLSHFLIRCIKRENENIINIRGSIYKTTINFHKIKEIDFIKLLAVVREKIDSTVDLVLTLDCFFAKEVSTRLEELDNVLKNCFFSQISDADVTEKFNVSFSFIDGLLNDCDRDLLELNNAIVTIQQEWEKKQQRGRLSKNRLERISQKIINSLYHDIITHIHNMGVILDRLYYGYSNTLVNKSYFQLSNDLLLQFHTELDGKQFETIVSLKHFQWELEQKTLALILEIKESLIIEDLIEQNDNVMFHCQLSPIKSNACQKTSTFSKRKSLLASTPALNFNNRHQKNITTDYKDLFPESNESSVLSLDSGILPASENNTSLTTSINTIDETPFPDDKEDFVSNEELDYLDSISSCLEPYPYKSLTTIYSNSQIQLRNENEENIVVGIGLDNYESLIDRLQIPVSEKEEMRLKIQSLISKDNENGKFNTAVNVTIYHNRKNPLDDVTLTLKYLEETFFCFLNTTDIQEMSVNNKWHSSLNIQDNNSACCPNVANKCSRDFNNQSDQNTNNNADSKDDESSDLNTSIDDDLVNNLSIYANVDLALNNSVVDSQTSELSDSGHDSLININDVAMSFDNIKTNDVADYTWQQYDKMLMTKSHEIDEDNLNCSLLLEDIELALKLSELHLKVELENEQRNDGELIDCKGREDGIVERQMGNCSNIEALEEIDENLETGWDNRTIVDISFNETEPLSPEKNNITQDNDRLSFSQRIAITISLTGRLLDLTRKRLLLISSSLNNQNNGVPLHCTSSNHSSTLYSLRQRLSIIDKIMINLKYSIKCSHYPETRLNDLGLIDKLIADEHKMSQFSYKLEEWIHKTDIKIDKTDTIGYLHDLPDDLLVKLESIDTESFCSLSAERLHVTISALVQYPCYGRLMNSSLKKFIGPCEQILANKPQDRQLPLSNSDLILEIHKLRRITAICALNIVDLHVIVAKIEDNYCSDSNGKVSELKELLLYWRIVDKECHRLLRCNSLIQHVMTDTRRAYAELVSLTAVITSIIRTVPLSLTETQILNQHLENINSYKHKIIEWLNELELCSSVVHRKRITNRRVQFYEDIHKYLEENLNSVSELTSSIKLGCQKTVKSLTTVLTYCCDLSSASMTYIDSALNTDDAIDNRHLNTSNNNSTGIIVSAFVDLEGVECTVSRLQDLLDNNKDLFQAIACENVTFDFEESVDTQKESKKENTEQIKEELFVLEKATFLITDKISTIATHAADNAILLFVDKSVAEKCYDIDTEQEISNWTSLSQNDDCLDRAVKRIADDIIAMLTADLFQNLIATNDTNLTVSYKLILGNICHHLGDKALHFMAENVLIDRQKSDDSFVCQTSEDLAHYFSEELSHLMIHDCVNSILLSECSRKNVPAIGACFTKLKQKLSHRLLEKSVTYIANFVSSFIDKSLAIGQEENTRSMHSYAEDLRDLPLPVSTYRLSKPIHEELIAPEEMLIKLTELFQSANPLPVKTYKCDIKKRLFPSLRITSNKISKLVAQFDRVATETNRLPKPNKEDIATNRISENESNETVRKFVKDVVSGIILPKKGNEILNKCEDESISELDKVTAEFAKLTLVSGDFYSSTDQQSNVARFCDFEKIPVANCLMDLREEKRNGQQLLNCKQSSTISENIQLNLKSSDVTQIVDDDFHSKTRLLSVKHFNIGSTAASHCLSTLARHFSPLLTQRPDSHYHLIDEEKFSLSDSRTDCCDTTIEKNNDSGTETYTMSSSDAPISDRQLHMSGEIVERSATINTINELHVITQYNGQLNCHTIDSANDPDQRSQFGASVNSTMAEPIEHHHHHPDQRSQFGASVNSKITAPIEHDHHHPDQRSQFGASVNSKMAAPIEHDHHNPDQRSQFGASVNSKMAAPIEHDHHHPDQRSQFGTSVNSTMAAPIEHHHHRTTNGSSNTHNCDNFYLMPSYDDNVDDNGASTPPNYEHSLAKLWLVIFVIFLLILFVALLFHNRIGPWCNCLSDGQLFLPKFVASGLPF